MLSCGNLKWQDEILTITESEADYIPEHNRIHCCQECYKDTYEPS